MAKALHVEFELSHSITRRYSDEPAEPAPGRRQWVMPQVPPTPHEAPVSMVAAADPEPETREANVDTLRRRDAPPQ
jgi:hypothetical protein